MAFGAGHSSWKSHARRYRRKPCGIYLWVSHSFSSQWPARVLGCPQFGRPRWLGTYPKNPSSGLALFPHKWPKNRLIFVTAQKNNTFSSFSHLKLTQNRLKYLILLMFFNHYWHVFCSLNRLGYCCYEV